jgi:hypothetical protein
MTGKDSITTETALASVSKLVRHSIQALQSDDKEATLYMLKVISSILENLDPYLDDVSTQGPSSLAPLIQETIHHDWKKAYADKKVSFPVGSHWSAGAYEGGFVAMVVKALKAKRVLEVSKPFILDRGAQMLTDPTFAGRNVHWYYDALRSRCLAL